jgi:hypothetical protein
LNNPPVLIVTAILVTNAAESRPEAKFFRFRSILSKNLLRGKLHTTWFGSFAGANLLGLPAISSALSRFDDPLEHDGI